ncbi:DNA polymerase III subunit delta [Candidatus Bipolaricaulota bacterium]|nr:DNA polymerase III subunit delta [Candidatus Bipolaricaulota bacterium]
MKRLALYFGEPYQRRKAAKKLVRDWYKEIGKPEYYRLEGGEITVSELGQHLGGPSLFSKEKIIRITQADEIEDEKAVVSLLLSHRYETERVLLESDSLSKRSSLYRGLSKEASTQEFSEPTKKNFPRFVNGILNDYGVRLTSGAKKWFTQIMELDLLRVEKEVQKLRLYREEGSEPLGRDELKHVVWTQGKDRLFDLFDDLFGGDVEGAIALLEESLRRGTDPYKIFYMLANEVRRNLQVKDLSSQGLSNSEISNRTGVYKWLVTKKKRQLADRSLEKLLSLLCRLHDEDVRMKTGRTKPEDALYRAVLALHPTAIER